MKEWYDELEPIFAQLFKEEWKGKYQAKTVDEINRQLKLYKKYEKEINNFENNCKGE